MEHPKGIVSFDVNKKKTRRTACVTVATVALVVVGMPRSIWAQLSLADASQAPAPQASASRRLTLDEALALAAKTSEQVSIARAGADRAAGAEQRARSALFP
ncbi:MAG: hypothetical protein GEU99_00250 [Luteitalea sp.]|nr:hypothetical protein [Luteitalea sp.]